MTRAPRFASHLSLTALALVGGLLAAPLPAGAAAAYTTTTFSYPGAMDTFATGVNDHGIVVGHYTSSDYSQHGFRYDSTTGTFTTVDYPAGSDGTIVSDITNAGHVAGYYFPSAGGVRNFIEVRGAFRTYRVTGEYDSYTEGVGPSGTTVGFHATSGGVEAWVRKDGVTSFFQVFSANTAAYDITRSGTVVGYYQASAQSGFTRTADGTVTAIAYPGAVNTVALGINDTGQVVGSYAAGTRSYFPRHGYLYADGVYTALPDVPGATSTYPSRINANGLIVGYYLDQATGDDQSFVMTPAA